MKIQGVSTTQFEDIHGISIKQFISDINYDIGEIKIGTGLKVNYEQYHIVHIQNRMTDEVILLHPNLYDNSMNNLLDINYSIFIDTIIQYLIIFNRIQKKFNLSSAIILNNNLDFLFCNGIVFNSVILLNKEKKKLKYISEYIQDYEKNLLTKNKKRTKHDTTIRKALRSMYQNI